MDHSIEDLLLLPATPLPAFDGEQVEMDDLIKSILSTKRCHNSPGELAFVAWLYKHLETLQVKPKAMAEGAVVVELGVGGKTLFSCHVDTCHTSTESDGSLQPLFFDPAFGHIFCGDKKSGCLGADDGAGVYVMLKMIEAGVKGSYIFHRGEEKGCISAWAMVAKYSEWLKKFDACIAFDRPDLYEVICTQGGQVCASVGYGTKLAQALSKEGLDYEVSHKGVLTDCKVYRQLIPECINLGVGYYNQHSNSEYLDWNHLKKLTSTVIGLDWDALKPERKIVTESQAWGNYQKDYYGAPYKGKGAFTTPKPAPKPAPVKPIVVEDDFDDLEDVKLEDMTSQELDDYVQDEGLCKAIMNLVVELDAERARVARLQMLLGL